jgi:hypothetical protein
MAQENRYARGKIYKIKSQNTDKIYIGSTCEPALSRRLAQHCNDYRNWKNGKHSYVSSFEILEAGDYDIILLEAVPCDSKDALHARENWYIEQNRAIAVNRHKAPTGLTYAEYHAQYYADNREEIAQKRAQYYADNRDKIAQYRAENREILNQWKKQKHACACGGAYTNSTKARHLKTVKHQRFIAAQAAEQPAQPVQE